VASSINSKAEKANYNGGGNSKSKKVPNQQGPAKVAAKPVAGRKTPAAGQDQAYTAEDLLPDEVLLLTYCFRLLLHDFV
jgi:hypothetical protein